MCQMEMGIYVFVIERMPRAVQSRGRQQISNSSTEELWTGEAPITQSMPARYAAILEP